MGQTADELEVDIQRKRSALTSRVSRLERRVRDDVDTVRTRSLDRVQEVKDAAASAGEGAAQKAESIAMTDAGSGTVVAEHPKALLASSAAAGLVLGMKTGNATGGGTSRRTDRGQQPGIVAMVAESVRDVIGAEANALVDAALDTATAGLKSMVTAGTGASIGGNTDIRPLRTLYREGRAPEGEDAASL